jgi:multisubunit Na+/H+ antiporter MnhB subunit
MQATGIKHRRNDALFDTWSVIHFMTGVLLGWIMDPFVALAIMVLWEPFERFLLSVFLKRYFDITFGFESVRNSLSDIVVDTAGVIVGYLIVRALIEPPFVLF